MTKLADALQAALSNRTSLLAALEAEQTQTYRLFHGTVEGIEGLTVDRYGPQLLVQTFREPIETEALNTISQAVEAALNTSLHLVYNHRGQGSQDQPFSTWHTPTEAALKPTECLELGVRYRVRGRHRGRDPLLYLDFRVVRRWLLHHSKGASVLNTFAYTCGAGVAAAVGSASRVWNVDVSRSSLEIGLENAKLNNAFQHFEIMQEDFFPVTRQLAKLPLKGRGYRRGQFKRLKPKTFDIVVLDPPTWAKSRFGAVDIIRDYESLFKPALLATSAGGVLIATNHSAKVDTATWTARLERCAQKAGRPSLSLEMLTPEADFPSFDGEHPLKIALCRV